MPNPLPVSFLSDFGTSDEFVGVVKSVIRTLAPGTDVVDVTHEIPRHDVRAGSLALVRSVQYLQSGVVLAVIDPDVGSDRRAVAVEVGGGDDKAYFVGPDNGLLASSVMMLGGATRAVELDNSDLHLPSPGVTFAARDIFAPAVARLCIGDDLSALGSAIDPLTLLPGVIPLPQIENGKIACEVLWVDTFGNVQLNVSPGDLEIQSEQMMMQVRSDMRSLRCVNTYADLKPGETGLIVDSYGMYSVAIYRGSAAEVIKLEAGDGVTLENL